jgi:hypothetical protein
VTRATELATDQDGPETLAGGGGREGEDAPMARAFDIVMRLFSTLLGAVVTLIGLVWIGQGLHIGPAAIMQGFMVSDRRWAVFGAILVLFGVAHLIWTNTRRARA